MAGVRLERVGPLRDLRAGVPVAGTKRLLSTAGGTQPRWHDSGLELFYMSPDSRVTRGPVTAFIPANREGRIDP
jgi:hypothetical protein